MLLTIPNHWKHNPSIYTFDSPTFNATVHYLVFGHHPSDHAFHRSQAHFIMPHCCYYSITSPPCDITYICSLHPSFFATRSKLTLLVRAQLCHNYSLTPHHFLIHIVSFCGSLRCRINQYCTSTAAILSDYDITKAALDDAPAVAAMDYPCATPYYARCLDLTLFWI